MVCYWHGTDYRFYDSELISQKNLIANLGSFDIGEVIDRNLENSKLHRLKHDGPGLEQRREFL